MTLFLAGLATYLIHSTLFLGLAALSARFVLHPAWRETVLKTALFGAILTATFQTTAGLSPLGGSLDVRSRPVAALEPTPLAPSSPQAEPGPTAIAESPQATYTSEVAEGNGAIGIPTLLVTAWALVAIALLVPFLAVYVRLVARLRRASIPEPHLQSLWDDLIRSTGVQARLVVSDVFAGPVAALGGIVCVPTRFARDLATDEQQAALAHELAHVARRDPEWRFASGLVARVLFVQPLNVLAAGYLRTLAETMADEWAVRRATTGSTLARCLVSVAKWGQPPRLGVVGIVERPSALEDRVSHLLDSRSLSRSVAILPRLALGCVLLATVTAAAPRTDLAAGTVVAAPLIRGAGHGPILIAPDSIATLDGRWAWAEQEVERQGLDGAWFGYAIARTRLHDGEVFIADSRGLDPDDLEGPSPLAAQLLGPQLDRAADLVGLFMIPGDDAPKEVAVRTMSMLGDLGGRPVVWLGVVPVEESLNHWTNTSSAWPTPLAARRVTAIAVHPLPGRVLPILDALALGNAPEEVRVQAVEGYSYHADDAHRDAILERLDRVFAQSPTEPVVHEAVRALARLGGADAENRLRNLLRSGPPERRRQVLRALEDVPAELRLALISARSDDPPVPLPSAAEDVGLAAPERGSAGETASSTHERPDELSRQESTPRRRQERAEVADDMGSDGTLSVGYNHPFEQEDGRGAAVWTTSAEAPRVSRRAGGYAFTTGDPSPTSGNRK